MEQIITKFFLPRKTKATNLFEKFLEQRGKTIEDVEPPLDNPRIMKGITEAVAFFKEAKEKNLKGVGFGDYDVDGLSASALFYIAMKEAGIPYDAVIPNRADGFGLNEIAVEKAKDLGADFIITFDNGSDRKAMVQKAHELGIKIIITDHHPVTKDDAADDADALINPNHPDNIYSFRDLCGAGVAFVLVQCLQEAGVVPKIFSDGKTYCSHLSAFAALGTVCDVMSVTGINRRIIKSGLMSMDSFPGLKSLFKILNIENPRAYDIAWKVGPTLNSAGRIGNSQDSFNLLISNSEEEAEEQAKKLLALNNKRKEISTRYYRKALSLLKQEDKVREVLAESKNESPKKKNSIVLYYKNWEHGMVGITAGRIAQEFMVPTFICGTSNPDDGLIHGSARHGAYDLNGKPISVGHILHSLPSCTDEEVPCSNPGICEHILITGGGHPAAGGFTLHPNKLTRFVEEVEKCATKLMESVEKERFVSVDVYCPFPSTKDVNRLMSRLEPTGEGFSPPVFRTDHAKVIFSTPINGGKSIKVRLANNEQTWTGVCWDPKKKFLPGEFVDLVYTFNYSHFNNSYELEIQDMDYVLEGESKTIKLEDTVYELD